MSRRGAGALALAVMGLLLAACGKKGPPLPPIVRIPAVVEAIETRRVGDTVYVTVRLPAQNVDGSQPADLARLELYAVTGRTPPPPARFLEQATRVATVQVAPEPAEAADEAPGQGGAVTLRDTIGDAARGVPQRPSQAEGDAADPFRRFYAAVAYSARGVTRGPGAVASVALVPSPPPPRDVTATYDAAGVRLQWRAPQAAADPAAEAAAAGTEGPPRFAVYRAPGSGAADGPPVAITPAPLDAPAFSEPTPLDGVERCYVVRTVAGAAPPVESEPSAPACVTPVDVFPPAAPSGLSVVAVEGAISLIWIPNEEPDLAGYVVLRGEPGSATLTPLTTEPVRTTQYVDRTVVAGRRYAYAVVAVDDRRPMPNVSAESNRVEETAR